MRMRYRMGEEPSTRSVQLLVSYAIRYPDISTVRYDPTAQTLRLSFLVKGDLSAERFDQLGQRLHDTLEVYLLINHRRPQAINIEQEELGQVSTITLERDLVSLTPEEIYTVVELMRQEFPGRLVTEPIEFFGEEELLAQDELIEEVLSTLAERRSNSNLIAIREEGRLMIFHK